MQLFALDVGNPTRSARWHMDRHVVKIPLEAAQMMSLACWHLPASREGIDFMRFCLHDRGYWKKVPHAYKTGKLALWVMHSRENFNWTLQYAHELLREYTYRYGRTHYLESSKKMASLAYASKFLDFPGDGFSDMPLAMPEEYQMGGVEESYRKYYRYGKNHLATWKYRARPPWYY